MAEETHVNVGGSWKRVASAHVKVSGAWRNVIAIYTKVAGVWERALAVFNISASGSALAVDTTATNIVTISITGGVSPFDVSWVRISGSTVPQITNPTGTSVAWTAPTTGTYDAIWRCTVMDAENATDTVDVNVTFTDLS